MITAYTIEKKENGSDQWVKCGLTHLLHLVVRNLVSGKQYQFRVLAENVYGVSDASDESEMVTTREPKLDIDYDRLGKGSFNCNCSRDTLQHAQFSLRSSFVSITVDLEPTHKKVNLDTLKGDVTGKYIICEQLGRFGTR